MRWIEKKTGHFFVLIGLFLGFLLVVGGTISSATASPQCVIKNIKSGNGNTRQTIKNARGIPGEDIKFGIRSLYTHDGVTHVLFAILEKYQGSEWAITGYRTHRSDGLDWHPTLEVGTDQELGDDYTPLLTTIPKKIDVAQGRILMEICKV